MNRTKFLMNLAKQHKVAHVSDVGEVSVVKRPRRACTDVHSTKENDYDHDSEEKDESTKFVDYESSGSEFIPSSTSSSSDGNDVETLENWEDCISGSPFSDNVIPIQPNITVAAEDHPDSSVLHCLENVDYGDIEHNAPESTNQPLICDDTAEFSSGAFIENVMNITSSHANITVAAEDHPDSSVLHCLENVDYSDIEHNAPESTNQPLICDDTAEFSSGAFIENVMNITSSHANDSMVNDYTKKQSARERPTICPICFNDVATHFTRHLLRHHGDNKEVKLLRSLKPRSKERLDLVTALRKQGYFHLKIEKGVLNPVRTSKIPNTVYFICTYCLGHYSKKLLYKHVKICKNKPPDLKMPGKNCLSKSQTFMASLTSKNHDFLRLSRIKAEVFGIMRPDEISAVAKNDPIICLYGEILLNKHKRQQIATVVSNKIREMARLLIALKSINTEIDSLFDALKPEMFQYLVSAAKMISGFDVGTKTFKSPSLALHMGTNLKIMCEVAFKIVVEKRNIPKLNWTCRDEKKTEIKELRQLIVSHWCNELSSLALKNLKEKQWQMPVQLPLTSDIHKFQLYLNNRADDAYDKLSSGQSHTSTNYKILTECVLTLTVMFNRKRIGDVQYLKIETYTSDSSASNQEAFMQSLTAVEKIISKKFKRVVTGGKGSKPVPILFSTRLQKFISCLIEIRKNSDIVPTSNPYLFANPGSENRWMSGTNVIRRFAQDCGVKNPALLTSTKFRKHIATTLQLMSMEDNEMEQVASFMGHTKKTHAEFYRLPQDIYQTAKVAKVLLLLEKGKGREFQGKSLNEIELQKDVYYSSESECNDEADESLPLSERALNRALNHGALPIETLEENESIQFNDPELNATSSSKNIESDKDIEHGLKEKTTSKNVTVDESNSKILKQNKGAKKRDQDQSNPGQFDKPKEGRRRWTGGEKKIVLKHFQHHIKKKIAPKKDECEELISRNKNILKDKDWVRVKTLVYNSYRQK